MTNEADKAVFQEARTIAAEAVARNPELLANAEDAVEALCAAIYALYYIVPPEARPAANHLLQETVGVVLFAEALSKHAAQQHQQHQKPTVH
jgi:hypothetical protein